MSSNKRLNVSNRYVAVSFCETEKALRNELANEKHTHPRSTISHTSSNPPRNAILWFPFTIWTTYAMCALRYIENLFAHIPHKKHPRWFKISINAGFFAVHAASHPHTLLDRIESLLIPIWHFMQRDVNRCRGRRSVSRSGCKRHYSASAWQLSGKALERAALSENSIFHRHMHAFYCVLYGLLVTLCMPFSSRLESYRICRSHTTSRRWNE